jgi:hypothetical protein
MQERTQEQEQAWLDAEFGEPMSDEQILALMHEAAQAEHERDVYAHDPLGGALDVRYA